jgi:hypothetical protein
MKCYFYKTLLHIRIKFVYTLIKFIQEISPSYPKGHLFKLGLTDYPTCERRLEEDESATHILCDCEAIAYSEFRHRDQFFMEPSDYLWRPHKQVLHFIQSVELIKGKHNRSMKVTVQGLNYYGPPLIHSFIAPSCTERFSPFLTGSCLCALRQPVHNTLRGSYKFCGWVSMPVCQ